MANKNSVESKTYPFLLKTSGDNQYILWLSTKTAQKLARELQVTIKQVKNVI